MSFEFLGTPLDKIIKIGDVKVDVRASKFKFDTDIRWHGDGVVLDKNYEKLISYMNNGKKLKTEIGDLFITYVYKNNDINIIVFNFQGIGEPLF